MDENKIKLEFAVDEDAVSVKLGKYYVTVVRDLDATEVFLQDNNLSHEYVQELLSDERRVKRLVRKIDLTLLPLLAGTYVLQYIDKQALSYAAVFDLFTDTGINQDQYSWFASVFYLAYLVAEYPWSYLAQRTLMGKVISGCVMVWGAILMITAATHDFGGMATCRFFLGVFESAITPLFIMIVGMWYTRDEQPFRAGVFYSCNGVGSMLGGILSYAIGQLESFAVWRAIFLLCGGVTIIWGVFLFFFLPDDITKAKRFTLEEKAILIGRGRLGRTGILNQSIKLHQVKEALTDPQVGLLTLFVLLNETINGGIANFGKLIIKGVVHDPLRTTALGIPAGAFQVLWILTGTFIASRFRNVRTLVMAIYLIPTIIGTAIMWKIDRQASPYGVLMGYYICGAYVSSLVLAMQMPATNLGGYTKRMTATAIVFAAYCIGNIIGPHAFLASESPTYATGCKLIIGCSATQVFVAMALRLLLTRRNKARDAAATLANDGESTALDEMAVDLTDFGVRGFDPVLAWDVDADSVAESPLPSINISAELFEKLYLNLPNRVSGDLRRTFANPTPLALIGFFISVGSLTLALMGWRGAGGGGAANICVYYFFGGLLQLLGAILEWIIGNTEGLVGDHDHDHMTGAATQTPTFNASLTPRKHILRELLPPSKKRLLWPRSTPRSVNCFSLAFIGVLVSMYMICAIRTNIVFVVVLVLLKIAVWLLVAAYWKASAGNEIAFADTGKGEAFPSKSVRPYEERGAVLTPVPPASGAVSSKSSRGKRKEA
ncbi:hypothetical protein LTR08_003683 [Meristemomyces frigidus]|nr:hypothetical protein LTR08_003683 [Meristemomyces frigidus]